MRNPSCHWYTREIERLLLFLLLVHALAQLVSASTPSPSPLHSDTKGKQQIILQNNNGHTENAEQDVGHKEQQGNTPDKPNDVKKSDPKKSDENKSPTATQTKPQNGGNTTATKTPKQSNTNNTKAVNKPIELKILNCSKPSDCQKYTDTACVQDPKDGVPRCLCGNRAPPFEKTFCRGISRFVKFPCTNDSQCIDNAECLLSSTNTTKSNVVHEMESLTTRICWCKGGFNSTEDDAYCLDELGKLKMDQEKAVRNLSDTVKNLKDDQKAALARIEKLENSGVKFAPSLAAMIVLAVSMIAAH